MVFTTGTSPWCFMFVILLFSFEEDSCYEPADKLHNSHDEFLQDILLQSLSLSLLVSYWYYLHGLWHDHGLSALPLGLGGSHHQGETSDEDEDWGQDGVGHDGLVGWLVVSSELQGDYWASQIWIILYSLHLKLPEIEIIFRHRAYSWAPLFRRLNIRFIIITRKYKNVRNCSVFTF